MQVWCCGKVLAKGEDAGGMGWMIQGVFSDESKALDCCKTVYHFIAPLNMDEPLPDGVLPWPGLRFPKTV